jgi:hypothetical protein
VRDWISDHGVGSLGAQDVIPGDQVLHVVTEEPGTARCPANRFLVH